MDKAIEYKIIKPVYYDKFACAMSACEDNCCNMGWKIFIDKKTYNAYRNVKNPEFIKKLDNHIKPVQGERINDFFYAAIESAKEGYCPFQTNEGLCEIHRDFGEDFLSVTCRSYPRYSRRMTDEYLELSVSMSCPEAVRIALFDKPIMEYIIEIAQTGKDGIVPEGEERPSPGNQKTEYLKFGWALRDAAITIMQNRSCPVAYRIIIIAMMLYDVVEAHDKSDAKKILEILEYYSNATYGEGFIEGFRNAEENEIVRLQMSTLLYYTIQGEAAHPHSSRLAELIERFNRLNEHANTRADTALNAMEFYFFTKDATHEHWDNFITEYEHVIENYLVNYMFSELFPMKYHGKGLDPYHHTFLLAEQYAILRILLCGNYNPSEGFSRQYIIQTISQVAVINQHSEKPLKVAESYKKAGINSPAHLFYLLL